jgi:hypothetical protein
MHNTQLTFAFALFLLLSCTRKTQETQAIASVYDKKLLLEEVLAFMPEGLNTVDSLAFVKNYTDAWIRENIILHQAEQVLPKENHNMKYRLEKYKRSLLLYEFEKQYLRDKLDTNVSYNEIQQHYTENTNDFILADYIVKVLYVKLYKSDKNKAKVKQWYLSTKNEDLIKLEKYCAENAVNYYNDNENWIYFNDLLREIPIKADDKTTFLKNNKNIFFEDDEYAYFVNIYEYKLKDAISPLSLEEENIKARILNARSAELIKQLRNDLINEAYNNNHVTNTLED